MSMAFPGTAHRSDTAFATHLPSGDLDVTVAVVRGRSLQPTQQMTKYEMAMAAQSRTLESMKLLCLSRRTIPGFILVMCEFLVEMNSFAPNMPASGKVLAEKTIAARHFYD